MSIKVCTSNFFKKKVVLSVFSSKLSLSHQSIINQKDKNMDVIFLKSNQG